MSKTYEKAPEEVTAALGEMMRRHHPELAREGVTIDVLMVSDIDEESGENVPTLKVGGYHAAATIKVVPLPQRALGHGDALLTIDAYTWDGLGAAERRALLDHELQHVELQCDDGGAVKRDDMKRPKLRLRLHDWNLQGFDIIAQRHGARALEVQAIRACQDRRTGQMRWEFDLDGENVASAVGRASAGETRPTAH